MMKHPHGHDSDSLSSVFVLTTSAMLYPTLFSCWDFGCLSDIWSHFCNFPEHFSLLRQSNFKFEDVTVSVLCHSINTEWSYSSSSSDLGGCDVYPLSVLSFLLLLPWCWEKEWERGRLSTYLQSSLFYCSTWGPDGATSFFGAVGCPRMVCVCLAFGGAPLFLRSWWRSIDWAHVFLSPCNKSSRPLSCC